MADSRDTTADNAGDSSGRRPGEPDQIVTFWLNEISAARKREKQYRKDGVRIRELYENSPRISTASNDPTSGELPRQPFAILYSNTETLMPALYSNIPRPVVQRRFKDDDPLGRHAAQAGQRMLEFLLDTNLDEYETFDDAMKAATLDALLPGRGVTAVKYDADLVGDVKQSELVCPDSMAWDRVFFGFARKWSKVPWVAYEFHIDKDEAERLLGKEPASKMVFTKGEELDDEDGKRESSQDEQNLGERKTALVYQIWDKAGGRKVRYVSPHYTDGYCKVLDDPLELTGFFNCPRPLKFVEKTNDLTPTALYTLYENQATELNRLTGRIQKIIAAIKARGIYAGDLSDDLQKVFEEDDNALVPAGNPSALSYEKGLANSIWFIPLDVLIQTLQQLYVAREACKQVIYEITGISDILRGASKASETLGAQEIKQQWGTLRIQPKQAEVQRYARDLLRMMLEVAATKFNEKTWAQMTGLPFLLDAQFNTLTGIANALQTQIAQETAVVQAQLQQQAAITGQPPAPPPPSPKIQQLQQVQAQLQNPKWADVLKMLRTDTQRAYRIDIETNSTVQPEAAEDQKNIVEMMTAMGQYLNGVAPLVQSGSMPFGAAKAMLLAITRRYRFGSEIEDEVNAMQPPQPPDDGSAKLVAMQAEAAKNLAAEQGKSQQVAGKAAADKLASDTETATLKTALAKTQAEKDLQARESKLAIEQIQLKAERDIFKLEQQRATESLVNKAEAEGTKLEFKKHAVGMEKAQAKANGTAKMDSAKAADSKLSEGVAAMKDAMDKVLTTVAEHSKSTQELVKAVSAPRKRRAIRGKDGRIESTIEEMAP